MPNSFPSRYSLWAKSTTLKASNCPSKWNWEFNKEKPITKLTKQFSFSLHLCRWSFQVFFERHWKSSQSCYSLLFMSLWINRDEMSLFGSLALYPLNIKLNVAQARLVQALENKFYISAFLFALARLFVWMLLSQGQQIETISLSKEKWIRNN